MQQFINNNFKKCGFNFNSNQCENRQCEHLKFIHVGLLSDQDCYDWNYDCIFDGIDCRLFDNIDCTQIKLKHQCIQYSQCKLKQNNCVYNVDCEQDITATTMDDCKLINTICQLDYINGQGCKYEQCEQILHQSQCDLAHTSDGMNSYWDTNTYIPKQCVQFTSSLDYQSKYGILIINSKNISVKCYWCSGSCSDNQTCDTTINLGLITHEDCYNQNILNTINYSNGPKCILKQSSCTSYIIQDSCKVTIDGLKCAWVLGSCKDFCMSIPTVPASNEDYGTSCILVDWLILSVTDCLIYTNICIENSSNQCVKITDCNVYNSSNCNAGKDYKGYQCEYVNGACQKQNTLENFLSLTNLDEHQLCEQFYPSGICTVKSKNTNCADLPNSCSQATQKQCILDKDRNRCYWKATYQCIQLQNCSNLGIENNTHNKCQFYLLNCTVNQFLNGCIDLVDCNLYIMNNVLQIVYKIM
ncbi:unnamed protein product [Paramecium sonneborni]|uniref:Uncharacterized protein n=1 Tax=Paramecium sonneborni TaxID=65129 RepID=A0A8S1RNA8_9CILI|nr:unnamed protein product [Paramecium sonneborni]